MIDEEGTGARRRRRAAFPVVALRMNKHDDGLRASRDSPADPEDMADGQGRRAAGARLELSRLADRALRISGWEYCEVVLTDAALSETRGYGVAGSLLAQPPSAGGAAELTLAHDIAGAAPALVLPDLTTAVARERYAVVRRERLASGVGVSLVLDEARLGVMLAAARSHRTISPDDVRRMIVLAEYTAAVIVAHQREAAQQALFDAIADPVFVVDANGAFRDCNAAYEQLRARPRSTIEGLNYLPGRSTHIDPDSGEPLPPARYATFRALRGESPAVGLYRYADDPCRTWHSVSTPLRGADGNIIGAVTVLRDVTEERDREHTLREVLRLQQERANLLDALPVGVLLVGPDGVVRDVNQAVVTVAGLNAADLLGRHVDEISIHLHLDGTPIPPAERPCRRVLNGERVENQMLRLTSRPQAVVRVRGRPLTAADNSIAGGLLLLEDATAEYERWREHEEQAHLAAERLALFDWMPTGLLVFDETGCVVDCSRATEPLLALSLHDLLGLHCSEIELSGPSGEPLPRERHPAVMAAEMGIQVTRALVRVPASGRRLLGWGTPLRSDAGDIVGAFVAFSEADGAA